MKRLRTVAGEVGKGLLAGLVGTVAMTVASTLESKIRKRPPSTTPATAAEKVLGIEARDDRAKRRLSTVMHFAYGTAWGTARAAIGRTFRALGIDSPLAAAAAHFAAVWGTELVILPALDLVPPVCKWGGREIAIDGFHHAVYVSAVDAAYRAIDRS